MSDLLKKLNGSIARELSKVLAEELATVELPENADGGEQR